MITAATALLGVRVAAVWAWDRRILACLALIFTLQAVCLFYSAAGVKVCLEVPYCAGGSSNPAVLFLYWVSPMICDLLLVILTISRAINLRKRKIKLGTASLIIKAGVSIFHSLETSSTGLIFLQSTDLFNFIFFVFPDLLLRWNVLLQSHVCVFGPS